MDTQGELDQPRRYITTHDDAGRSIFSVAIPEMPPYTPSSTSIRIGFGYATQHFPVDSGQENDLKLYKKFIEESPGMVVTDGSAARIADFPPGYLSPMHRTISVNYNFVIEGELEIILDSGETRNLKAGDMLIQRAINHAWRNTSGTQWARLAAVSFPATGVDTQESGVEGILDSARSHDPLLTSRGTGDPIKP